MPRALHFPLLPGLAVIAASQMLGQATLRITSPVNGTIVHPGETFPVNVSVSGGALKGVM